MGLVEDKLQYVDYIQEVAIVCDIEVLKNNRDELMNMSISKLDSISREVEEIYNLHKTSKRMDRVLEEIEEFGVDYVKDYYNLR